MSNRAFPVVKPHKIWKARKIQMKKQKNALLHQIEIAGKNMQYDEQVKRVLSDKIILAWILKYSIQEFKIHQ